MSAYTRRTFLKEAAMLAASTAVTRILPGSVNGSVHAVTQQEPIPRFFAHAKSLDVIAHRGGDDEWPGETMYAFKHAVALGVDVLEMDVYRTIDHPTHLVLMHNPTVNETTNGKGWVNSHTLPYLKGLNAGFHWNKGDDAGKFYGHKLEDVPPDIRNDLTVPTLEEVFNAFPQVRMNIEMKPSALSPVAKLCEMITDKLEDKILVASFSHLYLSKFRERCPRVATSASVAELINYKLLNKRPKASVIQITPELELEIKKLGVKIKEPLLTQKFVDKAHNDGFKVHAWTINDCKEMELVKNMGVDGIITDYPSGLLSLRDQGSCKNLQS